MAQQGATSAWQVGEQQPRTAPQPDAPTGISRIPTRTSELLVRLRDDLLTGELSPGRPLRMTVLRERYAVGLTPLREALFQLVAEGLVTAEDQRGFRAASVSWEDLSDLTEQRVFLESRALRLSIERGDLAWEARVLAAHHLLAGTAMLSDCGTLTDPWISAHREFHRVLVEACGSVRLLRFRGVCPNRPSATGVGRYGRSRVAMWRPSTENWPKPPLAARPTALCSASASTTGGQPSCAT